MTDVEMIKNDIQKLIDEAYKQGKDVGYDFGYHNGYNRGLNDAWECAKKIYKMTASEIITVFGGCSNWVDYSVDEAIAKVREYEDKQTKDDKQDKENKSLIKIKSHNFVGKQYVLYEDVLDLIRQIKEQDE